MNNLVLSQKLVVHQYYPEFDNIFVSLEGPQEPPLYLTAITANPANLSFGELGVAQQLQITGNYSDGSSQDLTSDPLTNYSSDDSSIASVDAAGLVTAEAIVSVTRLGSS